MEIDREHFSDNDDSPMVSSVQWRQFYGFCMSQDETAKQKDNKIILALFEPRTFTKNLETILDLSISLQCNDTRYVFDNAQICRKILLSK